MTNQTLDPSLRTHTQNTQQLWPERTVRMLASGFLPAPNCLTPLTLCVFQDSVSWCKKKVSMCSQALVTCQASYTEASICTNNSHPSAVQCQPYTHPEGARTKGSWLCGQSRSMNRAILGQSISEQMGSRLKKEGLTEGPSTANLWSKESHLGHSWV